MTHNYQTANMFSRSIAYIIDMVIITVTIFTFLFLIMGKTPKSLVAVGEEKLSLMDKYQFFAYFEPMLLDSHRDIFLKRFVSKFPLEATVGFILIPWFFWGLIEGVTGGSIGKLATGMRVKRKDGGKASVLTCTIRFFAKTVSTLIIFIGFLIAFFDKKKQSLHDKVANTLVLKK